MKGQSAAEQLETGEVVSPSAAGGRGENEEVSFPSSLSLQALTWLLVMKTSAAH